MLSLLRPVPTVSVGFIENSRSVLLSSNQASSVLLLNSTNLSCRNTVVHMYMYCGVTTAYLHGVCYDSGIK